MVQVNVLDPILADNGILVVAPLQIAPGDAELTVGAGCTVCTMLVVVVLEQKYVGSVAVTTYCIVLSAVLLGLNNWLAMVPPANGSLVSVIGAVFVPIDQVNVLPAILADNGMFVVAPLQIAPGVAGFTVGAGCTV